MKLKDYPLTKEGIEQAEVENMDLARIGAVKFGVAGNGRLVVIPEPPKEMPLDMDPKLYAKQVELWNSPKALRTPREAEAATVNLGPTRSLQGIIAGNAIAPRSQYSVGGADPIRREQIGKVGRVADVGQDMLEDIGSYGPTLATAFGGLKALPYGPLMAGAAGVKLLTSGLNAAIGNVRGDELYNETPQNAALTAGAAAGSAALYKRFGSRSEQIRRELDDLINRGLHNPKGTKVPKATREHVKEGIELDRPYTLGDWRRQPLTDLETLRPDIKQLPVIFDKFSLPIEYGTKPVKHGAKISADIARAWAEANGIDVNKYGIDAITSGLNQIYSGKDRGRTAFWPTSKDKPLTQEQYTSWASSLFDKTNEAGQFLHDIASDRVHIQGDKELDKQWAEARKAFGQRSSKATNVVRDITQTPDNKGLMRGMQTPIVATKAAENLGKKGKVKRGIAKTAAFLLPAATELFGEQLLGD
jgi:hypothetical protein